MQQPRLYDEDVGRRHYESGAWTSRLLVDYFDERAAAAPGKTAIVEAHRTWTYHALQRATRNLAASLLRLGVGRGDVIAAQLPNWAELPIVHLAADRIGAIFMPLSEGFREAELSHLLQQAQARVLFCAASLRGQSPLALIERLRPRLPALEHVLAVRAAEPMACFETLAADERWRAGDGEARLAAARGTADDPSHVMVSSGSTGMPRCSLYSDNNTAVKLQQQYVQAAGITSDDIAAALAPAGTGSTGYNYPILAMLLNGGTSVLLEHWSGTRLQEALDLIREHRCTIAVAVPAQLVKLAGLAGHASGSMPRLRVVTNAGAKLPASVAQAVEQVFGCKVQSIYGTSEAGAASMTSIHDPDLKRRTTVGRPLTGQEVRIVADDGSVLPDGQAGEICWRGSNKSFGFLNDAASTAKVWDAEGWLHSGDLGLIDPDGYLQIVGRKKDMIVRGGQNINPGAIEEVLLEHPSVREVAVVPFDDEVLGERIAACIVAADEDLTLESLKALVLARGMAVWHQPELLIRLDELPRNAGGKVDKRSLAALASRVASGDTKAAASA
ncbi:MAG: AMP-binding protein [Burkholderiales bacterium]|nr:AMP-binding protein [Burkholderiales bacterium]